MFKRNVILDEYGTVLANTDEPITILPPKSRIVKLGDSPAVDIKKIQLTLFDTGPLWIFPDND